MKINFTNRKSLISQKQRKNIRANTLMVITTLIILLLAGISSGMTAGILNKPLSQPFNEKSTNTTVLTVATIDKDIIALEPTIKNKYQSISPQTAQIMINKDQDIVVIDVRSSEEYEAGHIEKALLIPFSGCDTCFIYKTEEYRPKNIIVYGEDDEQSSVVCEALVENSFEHVYLLQGGLKSWQNNGFILTKDKSLSSGEEVGDSTNTHALGYVPPKTKLKHTVFQAPHYNLLDIFQVPRYSPLDNPPAAWDWRNATYNGITGDWTTPIRNQGSCGSCWIFSAIGALEAIINIKNNDPNIDLDLSEQYILSCYSGGWGCNGGYAYSAYQYLYDHGGAIPESCFPYAADDEVSCSNKCSDWSSKLIPISSYGVWYPTDRNSIKNQLIAIGPVVAYMDVYNDFNYYHGGIYVHQYGDWIGGHQVVIVGYNDNPGYWICKNSWGTSWGENGSFRIAYGNCQIEHEITYVGYNPVGPETYITNGPSGTIAYNDVTFQWNGSDNTDPPQNLVYSYILEGKDSTWSSWTSATSTTYQDLENGNYTFKVKAKDTQGYYDLTPATQSFTVEINYLLDQAQIQFNTTNIVYSNRWSAQSFKPSLGLLTKVALYVGKTGSPTSDLVVSIRSSLTGTDLVSLSKSSSGIPSSPDWVEFDLSDYSVTPDSTYYIVVRTSGGSSSNNYIWGYGNNNPYTNGSFWMSTNGGSSWTEYTSYDFCFKTYGGTNPPPNTPSIPSGPTNLIKNVEGYYTTSATDPDGEQVQYMFDWDAAGSHDYSDWSGLMNSGTTGGMSHSWSALGAYIVKARARDEHGILSDWSDGLTVVISEGVNNNPYTPTVPSGPATRSIGESGAYNTSATDPDNDQVQYRFDWDSNGTHDYSSWTNLVPSGQSVSMSHAWSNPGIYVVRAQARDEHGSSSNWSSGLAVSVVIGTETLDQQQTTYDKSNTIYLNRWSAQSFKPSLGLLTKVVLYVGKTGSPTGDLVVSIRSSLTGTDLVSLSKSSGDIPSEISWIEFDLPDYSVTPNSTYYIVVRTSGGSSSNNYIWGYSNYNSYTNGSFWMSTSGGSLWSEYTQYDFCFKTYGSGGGNSPPNVPTVPSGPATRSIGESGAYNTSATDPDNDQVQYRFDWDSNGAHDYSSWTNLVPSGQSANLTHSWSNPGSYVVRAQAKDSYGNEGPWSNGLTVSVTAPNNNPPNIPNGPSPSNHATDVSINADISWSGGDPDAGDTVTYDVYFGTTSPPSKISGNQSATIYDPGTLNHGTTYYWQIVAWDNHGASSSSPTWDFTTHNDPPNTPSNPNPTNHATGISVNADLSWTGGDPNSEDTVTYDVYFGTNSPPLQVAWNQSSTTYDPGTMNYNTQYYWKIVAWDNHGASTAGAAWNFTTIAASNNPPNDPSFPTGPSTRLVGESGIYSTSVTDPDNDQVQYRFDWDSNGAHDYSSWTNLVPSGQSANLTHSWSNPGTYVVRAQARDEHGSSSNWSSGLTVSVTTGTETLDQQQTTYDKSNTIYSNRWSAQSFKPSLGLLTKVALYVGKTGSPTSDLVVSIRSSLTGTDLVSLSKSSNDIQSAISWVEFDLPDYSLTPGNTYYIVVRTSGGSSSNNYIWGYSNYNSYTNGSFWMSTNGGSSWSEYTQYDFCFKTYGI